MPEVEEEYLDREKEPSRVKEAKIVFGLEGDLFFFVYLQLFIEHLLRARHYTRIVSRKAQKRWHLSCVLKDEYV